MHVSLLALTTASQGVSTSKCILLLLLIITCSLSSSHLTQYLPACLPHSSCWRRAPQPSASQACPPPTPRDIISTAFEDSTFRKLSYESL